MDLPDDLPVVERTAVRVILLDTDERVLLFHAHDPTYPELGRWWELPGGGLEAAETIPQAAVRELREETGIGIGPDLLGPVGWRRSATYRYHGERRLQHESVVIGRLPGTGPEVDGSGRVGFENEDYFGFRWWPVAEVANSAERFYPGRLPEMLPRMLSGEVIDEPFEYWS